MLSDFSDIAFVVMATVISLIVKVNENTVLSNTGYFFYIMIVNYEKMCVKFGHTLCNICPVWTLVLVTIAIGIEIKNSEHLYSSLFFFFIFSAVLSFK